ncbi:MAG TPA: DUF3667 domain-containing protein [Woeseiaceae bacterium]|nr:DUF3667 domain-containing protein [Woeseiaceae bacterium]
MDESPELGSCLNCGASLMGQYCGNCGQRATSRLISIWELLRDAFGDLLELDSRLWRTLFPLLLRPGKLTEDYLKGRRARYMPPFRMYLVFSLIFFLVAFFDPHNDFAIFYEDGDKQTAPAINEIDPEKLRDERQQSQAELRAALDELIAEGVIDESIVGAGKLIDTGEQPVAETRAPTTPGRDQVQAESNSDNESQAAALAKEQASGSANDANEFAATIGDELGFNCEAGSLSLGNAPGWVQKRLTPERIKRLCRRWEVEGSEGLLGAMIDKVPAALILLLPFMALVLKILYPLSRRYYVEHLLFLVHYHAFFFLLLTLQILWMRMVQLLGIAEAVATLPLVATSFYIPVYLFMAMRRVYGQGRFLTFLKFSFLTIIYLLGLSLVLLGALFLAAFAI